MASEILRTFAGTVEEMLPSLEAILQCRRDGWYSSWLCKARVEGLKGKDTGAPCLGWHNPLCGYCPQPEIDSKQIGARMLEIGMKDPEFRKTRNAAGETAVVPKTDEEISCEVAVEWEGSAGDLGPGTVSVFVYR
jgi:hypothetical protein